MQGGVEQVMLITALSEVVELFCIIVTPMLLLFSIKLNNFCAVPSCVTDTFAPPKGLVMSTK